MLWYQLLYENRDQNNLNGRSLYLLMLITRGVV